MCASQTYQVGVPVMITRESWGFKVLKYPLAAPREEHFREFFHGPLDIWVPEQTVGTLSTDEAGAFGEFYVQLEDEIERGNVFLRFVRVRPDEFVVLH